MNNLIIGLLLVVAPLAFAAFLLFFMMSGKGSRPIDEDSKKEDNKKGHSSE